MAAVRHLDDLGDAPVLLLLLERGVGDRPRHCVVLFAGDDKKRTAVGILRIDLHLGPRIEIGRRRLEEGRARRWYGKRLIELLRLLLAHGVGEAVAELLVGEGDGAVPVGGIAEHRPCRLERRDR